MNEKALSDKTLRNKLKAIINNDPNSIKADVAREALDHEDISCFFTDLQRFGCQSGRISSLIYYSDTHAFFDQHYDEIEELRSETKDSLNEPLNIRGDLKSWLAWFAFEEIANQISKEFV